MQDVREERGEVCQHGRSIGLSSWTIIYLSIWAWPQETDLLLVCPVLEYMKYVMLEAEGEKIDGWKPGVEQEKKLLTVKV